MSDFSISEEEAIDRFNKIVEIHKAFFHYAPNGRDMWIDKIKVRGLKVATAKKALERLAKKNPKAPGLAAFEDEYWQVVRDVKKFYRDKELAKQSQFNSQCLICNDTGNVIAAHDINYKYFSPLAPSAFRGTIYKAFLPCYGYNCLKGQNNAARMDMSEPTRRSLEAFAFGASDDQDAYEKFENYVKVCHQLAEQN